jgi:hypothetical protein
MQVADEKLPNLIVVQPLPQPYHQDEQGPSELPPQDEWKEPNTIAYHRQKEAREDHTLHAV